MSRLIPTITTGIGVTTAMFIFAYLPQAALLTIFNGPLAIFTTIVLVLNESSTITNILARTFFIQDALLDTFDGVCSPPFLLAFTAQLTSNRRSSRRTKRTLWPKDVI